MNLVLILWHFNSEPESGVVLLKEDGKPEERVEIALQCLPNYDPAETWTADTGSFFRYWKIRDYAYAYRAKLTTPSIVSQFQLWGSYSFHRKLYTIMPNDYVL